MSLKKKILNFIGICEKCGADIEFNQVHNMKGQIKDSKEYFICPKCKAAKENACYECPSPNQEGKEG